MSGDSMHAGSISRQKPELSFARFSSRNLAKHAVLGWFATLTRGHLILVDGAERFEFGEAKEKARVSGCIHVLDSAFYVEILHGGAIGSGESYMRGHWSSPNLVDAVRVLAMNINQLQQFNGKRHIGKKVFAAIYTLLTVNSVKGAKKNIAAHYDLGNDFFGLFLDKSMMYSAAIYQHENDTLETAAEYKLESICQKLQLTSSDHVMEIGTGWGGFAIFAATHYGCKVSTTTISEKQYEFTCARVRDAGLEDKITVMLKDYRELEGRYDKLVSIEMIEAVGHQFHSNYFEKCNSLLKEDGLMLIQAITISDQRFEKAKRSVDFIQRYIFPGGCLPSNAVIAKHLAEDTNMQLADLHDISYDYALTLRDWRQRFFSNIEAVRQQGYNDVFIRMWDFYLAYCEGAFRERVIQTSQFLISKPECDYRAVSFRS